jgi:plastocyanin
MRLVFIGLIAALGFLPRPAPESGPAMADSLSVAVRTFQFAPERLTVKAGTRVVWLNEDEIEHTATAGSAPGRDSLFDLPLAHKGARAAFTFEQPGSFAYYCAKHPFMRGEIRVTPKGDKR